MDLNAELIFLHFRKALEEISFASLSANREKYSAARAGFATEWNARRMHKEAIAEIREAIRLSRDNLAYIAALWQPSYIGMLADWASLGSHTQ